MTLDALCRAIALPEPVRKAVLAFPTVPDGLLIPLTRPETARETCERIQMLYSLRKRGLDVLSCQLQAALYTRERYLALGMGEDIFLATMGCYSRFVGEYRRSYGEYGFDRGWWTWRQLSGQLFRFGELEYEFCQTLPQVHLHVPTGARLEPALCRDSLARYRAFARQFFPERAEQPVTGKSWLFSPALSRLLPPDSRILRFQRSFTLTDTDPRNREFLHWIFGRDDIPPAELPENTRLQRAAKAYLLQGGMIGSGSAILRDFDGGDAD